MKNTILIILFAIPTLEKKGMKSFSLFFVLIFIGFPIYGQNSSFSPGPKNAFSIDAEVNINVIGSHFRYERTITEQLISKHIIFDVTPYTSYGYADNTGHLDRAQTRRYFRLGSLVAFKFFSVNQLELGIYASHERFRQAYLSVSEEDQLETDLFLFMNFGYRLELKHFLFKVSINPRRAEWTPLGYEFFPGVGIGFRI